MNKIVLFSAFLLFFSEVLLGQNFLSPAWKISFSDTSAERQNHFNISNWQNVNLLLSWERQGYFARDGECCLANKFFIPVKFKDEDFILTLSLQCNVESIYINGKYVGGNIQNQFWSNRGAQTIYNIPKNFIATDAENVITIFASGLSYTGGKSHNLCLLTPSKTDDQSELKISVPAESHLFSAEDRNASINIEYKTPQEGLIDLFIVSDFHDTLVQTTFNVVAGEGTIPFNFAGQINKPGFYECVAIMKNDGYTGDVKWFTISPEKIECSYKPPAAFKKYWDDALKELKEIKPEFSMRKVDELSTGTRDGYIAEMKSLGGITIRGYYFVPRKKGKHGAILHVPGYGYGFDNGKPFINNNEDVIELAVCVRGHGISSDVFNPGFDIPGIWGYKLYSEKENAFRSIYMDCVRAVEFLLSRTEVDENNICVMGGSQGGGLTLATAGLCPDVIKACAYFDPFVCEPRDHLKIRTLCNREIQSYLDFYNNPCSFSDALNIQDLIDTKWFADWINCPVFFYYSII